MKISFMVELEIPEERLDVNRIEEMVYEKRQEIGKRLMAEIMEEIQEKATEETEGIKAGFVNCYWITRLGVIRIKKQRKKTKERSFYPLDCVFGDKACVGATEWVKRRGVELSCDYPYRKAAEILKNELGFWIGRTTLHGFVGEAGKRYSEKEDAKWKEMGKKRDERQGGGGDLTVIEIDATYIHQQRRKR